MQEQSLNSLRKRLKLHPHLDDLEQFITKVIDETNPKLLMLYGSLARNEHSRYSDIDILCVFDKKFVNRKQRFHHTYKYSTGIVQPKNITIVELRRQLKEGNPFLLKIFEDGIVLFSNMDLQELQSWIKEGRLKSNVEYFRA